MSHFCQDIQTSRSIIPKVHLGRLHTPLLFANHIKTIKPGRSWTYIILWLIDKKKGGEQHMYWKPRPQLISSNSVMHHSSLLSCTPFAKTPKQKCPLYPFIPWLPNPSFQFAPISNLSSLTPFPQLFAHRLTKYPSTSSSAPQSNSSGISHYK